VGSLGLPSGLTQEMITSRARLLESELQSLKFQLEKNIGLDDVRLFQIMRKHKAIGEEISVLYDAHCQIKAERKIG
jgi:hypothetical protein